MDANEKLREDVQTFARKEAAKRALLGPEDQLFVGLRIVPKRGHPDFERVRRNHHLTESDWEKLLNTFKGKSKKKHELVQRILATGNEPMKTEEVACMFGIAYVDNAFIGPFNSALSKNNVPVRLRLVNRISRGEAASNFVRFYREE